jgi:hypothetical protein
MDTENLEKELAEAGRSNTPGDEVLNTNDEQLGEIQGEADGCQPREEDLTGKTVEEVLTGKVKPTVR